MNFILKILLKPIPYKNGEFSKAAKLFPVIFFHSGENQTSHLATKFSFPISFPGFEFIGSVKSHLKEKTFPALSHFFIFTFLHSPLLCTPQSFQNQVAGVLTPRWDVRDGFKKKKKSCSCWGRGESGVV